MFSYWFGKIKGKDIRQFGDGNPGAVNAFKAVGWKIGIPAMLLDYLKGVLPLFFIIRNTTINDFRLIPIAIAPVLGHAFSPFLKFRGGKTITTTFGVWTALTLWEVPTILGLTFTFLKYGLKIKNDALVTLLGMLGIPIYLINGRSEPALFVIWFLNILVVLVKHGRDLKTA